MVGTRSSAGITSTKAKTAQTSRAKRNLPASQGKIKTDQETSKTGRTAAKARSKKRAKPSYLPYDAEHDPNSNNRLLDIPGEVFLEIASLLEPDSLTCLSLTCKKILSIVGTESWAQCCSKRQFYDQAKRSWCHFRQSLIPLLGRDAPHLVTCDVCGTLHPPLKPPREHRQTPLTKQCFGQWSSIDYFPRDEHAGYNLIWEHIVEARKSLSTNNDGSSIELLEGKFTVRHQNLDYTLASSGRQIEKNLILKHEHIFVGKETRHPLRLADIMALPIRLCPHQTTSTEKPGYSQYTKGKLPSGLLYHSIVSATPQALRSGLPTPNNFCNPTPSEQRQIDSGGSSGWTCRACPTKWKVRYSDAGKLKITAWHSFGDTAYRAQEYWKMLVRREVSNLGEDKRNSEFFLVTRQYLDFAIEHEE